jgi:uncharacterized integral membrane protein
MVRLFGWLVGAPLAAALAIFAVANRTSVATDLWPLPWTVEAPLYLFVLVALLIGFLAGAFVAWISALAARRRIRAEARAEVEAARRAREMPPARLNPLNPTGFPLS